MGFWNFFNIFGNDSFHVTSSDDDLSPFRHDDDNEPFPYSDVTDSSFGTGSIFEDSLSTTSSFDSFDSFGSDSFGSDSFSSGTGFDDC